MPDTGQLGLVASMRRPNVNHANDLLSARSPTLNLAMLLVVGWADNYKTSTNRDHRN
jgi:hypothetical protein